MVFSDRRLKSLLSVGAVILFVFLAGCVTRSSAVNEKKPVSLNVGASETIVIIYNHGTRNPRKKERCNAAYNNVPLSLTELASDRFIIYYLCSSATEGPARHQAGNQVYARMFEIEQVMDNLINQGIKPVNIFLAGHSKGAWASLMLMQQVNRKFNAAILFAPALANRRSANNYPWWRGEVRGRQISQMLNAKNIEALIFAYIDDEYNRPGDLQFLIDHDPDSVKIQSYRCDYPYTHNTHLHDCRHQQTKSLIIEYIHSQIRGFNET